MVRATVELGGLDLADVEVQATYGRVDEADRLLDPATVALAHLGTGEGGGQRFEGTIPLRRTGAFGYTVRVLPRHPQLASPAELGLVANPD